MAYRINPTPTEVYVSNNTKKKKQTSGYVTNTVTPPPQPAENTTPSMKNNYEQSVPQPPKVTTAGAKSTYNPLTIKQNAPSSPSIADTIHSKPSVYDSAPIPQTFVGGNKLPKQNSSTYTTQKQTSSYTAPKAAKNQVYGQSAPKTNYGPNRETAQYMSTATYQPKQNKPNSS